MSTNRSPAVQLTEAVHAVIASFTEASITGIEDVHKRAQLLVTLLRARKLLDDLAPGGHAVAAVPTLTTAPLPTLSVEEWERANPPRLRRTEMNSDQDG